MAWVAAAIGAVAAVGSAAISASNRPKPTQTSVQQQTLRPEAERSVDELQMRARDYAAQPYEAYTGEQIAGFTPDQLAAMGLTGDVAATSGGLYGLTEDQVLSNLDNSGVPLSRALADGTAGIVPGSYDMLGDSSFMAGTSGNLANAGLGITAAGVGDTLGLAQRMPDAGIDDYMNPYLRGALDPALTDLYERSAQQRNELAARSARTGSFGGSRNAIAESELERLTEREAGRLSGTMHSDAFDKAVGQWRADQSAIPGLYRSALGLVGQSQDQQRSGIDAINAALQGRSETQRQGLAGQQALSNVANLENMGLGQLASLAGMNASRLQTEANPLMTVGGMQQALNQQSLDKDYAAFLEERDWASRGLQQLQGAIGSGVGGLGASTSYTSPINAGNRTAQIMGAGLMGGSMFSGQTGQSIAGGLSSLFNGGSNTTSSNQTGFSNYDQDYGGASTMTSYDGSAGYDW